MYHSPRQAGLQADWASFLVLTQPPALLFEPGHPTNLTGPHLEKQKKHHCILRVTLQIKWRRKCPEHCQAHSRGLIHVKDLYLPNGQWVYFDLFASFLHRQCHVNKEVDFNWESTAGGLYRETHWVRHLVKSELGYVGLLCHSDFSAIKNQSCWWHSDGGWQRTMCERGADLNSDCLSVRVFLHEDRACAWSVHPYVPNGKAIPRTQYVLHKAFVGWIIRAAECSRSSWAKLSRDPEPGVGFRVRAQMKTPDKAKNASLHDTCIHAFECLLCPTHCFKCFGMKQRKGLSSWSLLTF